MAGSRRWYTYTTDAGDDFHLEMDESNAEVVGNTEVTGTPVNNYAVPANIRPRIVRYRSADGLRSREIPCSTQAILDAAPATASFQDGLGGTFTASRTSFRGEQLRRLPQAADTGVDDGD